MPDRWSDVPTWLANKFSPKVLIPFLLLQAGNAVVAFVLLGGWDYKQTIVAGVVFVFGVIGVALPPAFTAATAPTLTQADVVAVAKTPELRQEAKREARKKGL